MNVQSLLHQFQGNAMTLMLGAGLHYATEGHVDTRHLDAETSAIALCGLLSQIEAEHPGTAEKYGWVRTEDAAALARAISGARQATAPDGLN